MNCPTLVKQMMRVSPQILPNKNASYLSTMIVIIQSFTLNVHQIFGEIDETMAVVSLFLTRPWGNS